MPQPDPYKEQDLERLQIFMALIPVLGFLPALWTLHRQQGSAERQNASRLVVTLTLSWLLSYGLLGLGSQFTEGTSAVSTLTLLLASSFLTTGYFLTNFWLMVRLWQRKSLRLPGFSQLSDRLP